VLCNKASKHYVYERETEIKKEFNPLIEKITSFTENLFQETADIKHQMQLLDDSVAVTVLA
jgi:hypothetical protein